MASLKLTGYPAGLRPEESIFPRTGYISKDNPEVYIVIKAYRMGAVAYSEARGEDFSEY